MARDVDTGTITKLGTLLGVGLFVVGAAGQLVGHALSGSLPAWERTLFFDMEVVGVITMLVVPFVFGIAIPLTE